MYQHYKSVWFSSLKAEPRRYRVPLSRSIEQYLARSGGDENYHYMRSSERTHYCRAELAIANGTPPSKRPQGYAENLLTGEVRPIWNINQVRRQKISGGDHYKMPAFVAGKIPELHGWRYLRHNPFQNEPQQT
ncbi:hypothetical protein H6F51_23785 [Cyanobacteria bacterium FACHB-DQ100]|nr:hypothetical protein [Cyanobacteria bacterium FACHB-DQ100]